MSQLEHPLAVSPWDDAEVEAAQRVLASGHTTMGPHVARFEGLFARRVGCRYGVMVNSGSSANLLMVAALLYTGRIGRGAQVAVPAVAWSTTVAPLQQLGMQVVVVDVDATLNINPALIPPDVDVIFAVNALGNPCDYDAFPRTTMILEDNCEGLGASYHGRPTGAQGLMASHSLFFSHHISTMEGGVVTTNDRELYEMLLMLRSHGWTRDLPNYQPGFGTSWGFHVPGFNVRPTEVQGAIGLQQLAKLDGILAERWANGSIYKGLINHQQEVGQSSWFGFAVMSNDRDRVIDRLDGIELRPILAGNILRHRMMDFCDVEVGDTPMADRVHDCGFFVGNHGDMREVLGRVHEVLEVADAA